MNNSERVFINTLVQYFKTIVSLFITLYTTRLILSGLGVEDYGIYSLIGGVVSLLSFVVNALVISTQRFLSYNSGEENSHKLKLVFSNSLFVHISLGFVVIIIFELIGDLIVKSFLNIPINRLDAAMQVYHIVVMMIFLSFVTSPFRALLISRENITYISLIDIIDCILKLLIAISLSTIHSDKLVVYSLLLCGINLFNLFAFAVYDFNKYSECVFPRYKHISRIYIKPIFSFALWNSLSVLCITGRTQGVSIIINKYYSLIINAAYGLGLQVNSALGFISQSVRNALNPQIMRAEGNGEREKMIYLASLESKVCFLLMGIILIPCIFELESLVKLWLGYIPEYSILFITVLIITNIVDQYTIGLEAANQSYGKIRIYALVVNACKLLTIPAILFSELLANNIFIVLILYAVFELLSATSRIFILKRQINLSISLYIKTVVFRGIVPIIITIICCALITNLLNFNFSFIVTIPIGCLIGLFSGYYFSFDEQEKKRIRSLISKLIH